ncbi:unnamed protein product, partial [Linum tenue]
RIKEAIGLRDSTSKELKYRQLRDRRGGDQDQIVRGQQVRGAQHQRR